VASEGNGRSVAAADAGRGVMQKSVLLGASGRVGALMLPAWPDAAGGAVPPPVAVRRDGRGGLSWDALDADPPPPLPGPPPVAVLGFAGVTPGPAAPLHLNAALGRAAVRAAAAWGARHAFVASSAAVYGRPGADPVSEDAAARPESPYGRAMLEREDAVSRAAAAAGIAVTLLRIGNVAGASEPFVSAAGRDPVVMDVFADGRGPMRSYVGPAGLARVLAGLIALAAEGRPLPRLLNLGGRAPAEMNAVLTALGRPFATRPAPPAALPRMHLDTSRLEGLCPGAAGSGAAADLVAELRSLATAGQEGDA